MRCGAASDDNRLQGNPHPGSSPARKRGVVIQPPSPGRPKMPANPLRIPYGVTDFVKLRQGNEYYVDNTHYLPLLESAGRFLFLIRPRRLGKSPLQSVTECYYDCPWFERFEALFADTAIIAHPTPEPIVNSDMALYFLQSLVGIGAPPDELIDLNVRIDYGKLRHPARCQRAKVITSLVGVLIHTSLPVFSYIFMKWRVKITDMFETNTFIKSTCTKLISLNYDRFNTRFFTVKNKFR
jgi:hypothetical protein